MPIFANLAGYILPRIFALGIFALVVTASGVIIALRNKEFQWRRLGDFAGKIILPKLGGWLCMALPTQLIPADLIPAGLGWTYDALVGIEVTVYTAVLASLIGHLFSNLNELGVLPKPTELRAKVFKADQ